MNSLAEIVNKPWYIDFDAASTYGWAINALIEGRMVFEADRKDFEPKQISQKSATGKSNNQKTRNVSVIPIQGPLMKKDQYCGPVGMDTISRYIREADSNPDIDAIILDIDSPGGTVAGTAMLGKTIANTKKPIIGYVNELAASAAYWLASQTDEIIASDDKAMVGSIGVMLSFADIQPAWELMGVKFHSIVSDLSEEKNKLFEDVKKGNYKEYKEQILNPLAQRFINTVKGGRGSKITDESIFKGRVDFADKALGSLVDSIGSFDFAVARAIQLADTKNQNAFTHQTNSLNMKKYPLISAAIKAENLEMSDEGSFLNEANLDALEATLGNHTSVLAKAETERDVAKNALTEAEGNHAKEIESKDTQIQTLTAEVKDKDNQITALTKGPGEKSASQRIDSKSDVDEQEPDEFMAGFNACKGDTAAEMAYLKKNGK